MHLMENSILQYFFRNRPRIASRIGRLLTFFWNSASWSKCTREERVSAKWSTSCMDGDLRWRFSAAATPGWGLLSGLAASHCQLLQATKPIMRIPGLLFDDDVVPLKAPQRSN